jgi:hypothetical protein
MVGSTTLHLPATRGRTRISVNQESTVNRNLCTWIQLAASLCSAAFLVLGHVGTPAAQSGFECVATGYPSHLEGGFVASPQNPGRTSNHFGNSSGTRVIAAR